MLAVSIPLVQRSALQCRLNTRKFGIKKLLRFVHWDLSWTYYCQGLAPSGPRHYSLGVSECNSPSSFFMELWNWLQLSYASIHHTQQGSSNGPSTCATVWLLQSAGGLQRTPPHQRSSTSMISGHIYSCNRPLSTSSYWPCSSFLQRPLTQRCSTSLNEHGTHVYTYMHGWTRRQPILLQSLANDESNVRDWYQYPIERALIEFWGAR